MNRSQSWTLSNQLLQFHSTYLRPKIIVDGNPWLKIQKTVLQNIRVCMDLYSCQIQPSEFPDELIGSQRQEGKLLPVRAESGIQIRTYATLVCCGSNSPLQFCRQHRHQALSKQRQNQQYDENHPQLLVFLLSLWLPRDPLPLCHPLGQRLAHIFCKA